jgi:DNA polymerase III delta prime subunit
MGGIIDKNIAPLLDEPYDPEAGRQRLEKAFAEEIIGQEDAKREIRGLFSRVTMDRAAAKHTGNKPRAHIVVFNGASGVGKTLTAMYLANSLSNCEPFVISAAEVDVAGSKKNLVESVFGNISRMSNLDTNNMKDISLSDYLEKCCGKGVVIINEYDKMVKKGDVQNHPLDEYLRVIYDEGKININGRLMDFSGTTIILTTNETAGSLSGQVVADSLTKKLVDPTIGDDNTGSRTIVMHDKSFLNRLTVMNFSNLTAAQYAQIAKNELAPWLEFFKTDECNNVHVEIGDEVYESIGKYTERINEGARPIDVVCGRLFTALVEKTSGIYMDKGKEGDMPYNIRLRAIYDAENNTFVLEEMDR